MEEKEFLVDKRNNLAFQIILDAGDARALCEDALVLLEKFKFDEARTKMKEAKEKINCAHRVHTEILQEDIADPENSKYSMIFTHAQDTLMTINSEYILSKQMIELLKKFDERLSKVEEKVND